MLAGPRQFGEPADRARDDGLPVGHSCTFDGAFGRGAIIRGCPRRARPLLHHGVHEVAEAFGLDFVVHQRLGNL